MPEEYDFNRLQADAVRRAREMQSRARIPQISEKPQPTAPTKTAVPAEPEKTKLQTETAQPTNGGLLETLFQDKERTVILALLILLSGEESNHELLFALMFLLM